MIDLLVRAIHNHGWHVVAELTVLALVTVFTVIYLAALVRGRVRAVTCASCGRITSRARNECPRCRHPLPSTS
jgi:predicted amidophosphoribosyltransferase